MSPDSQVVFTDHSSGSALSPSRGRGPAGGGASYSYRPQSPAARSAGRASTEQLINPPPPCRYFGSTSYDASPPSPLPTYPAATQCSATTDAACSVIVPDLAASPPSSPSSHPAAPAPPLLASPRHAPSVRRYPPGHCLHNRRRCHRRHSRQRHASVTSVSRHPRGGLRQTHFLGLCPAPSLHESQQSRPPSPSSPPSPPRSRPSQQPRHSSMIHALYILFRKRVAG